MPQDSVLFAVGRIKALENGLLTRDRLDRIVEAQTPQDALRLLQDAGYGASAEAEVAEDFEKLILAQLTETRQVVDEVSPVGGLTELILARYDFANMKALFRMRLREVEEPLAISPMGRLPLSTLTQVVEGKEVYDVPEYIKDAVAQVNSYLVLGQDPARVDQILDAAYFAWALEGARQSGDPMVAGYFTAWVDAFNVAALLRLRAAQGTVESLRQLLIPGGEIPEEDMLNAFVMPFEQAEVFLLRYFQQEGGRAALSRCLQENISWPFEQYMENYLLSLVRSGRNEIFTMEPVFGFLLARLAEASAVRWVMVGKINRLPLETMRERMRELYG